MKINYDKVKTPFEFGDLEEGEIFSYQGFICIKTEKLTTEFGARATAIMLNDGSTVSIEDDELVYDVEYTFTIRE